MSVDPTTFDPPEAPREVPASSEGEHPACQKCGRGATDWIEVRGASWTPDLRICEDGQVRCWWCRRELHPDMRADYFNVP